MYVLAIVYSIMYVLATVYSIMYILATVYSVIIRSCHSLLDHARSCHSLFDHFMPLFTCCVSKERDMLAISKGSYLCSIFFFLLFLLLHLSSSLPSVQHILIECADLVGIRKKYLERSLYSTFRNVIPEVIFNFFREIGVYYKTQSVLKYCLCEVCERALF